MADEIKYPFGAADEQAMTATGAQALTITDQVTLVDGVTVESTGNRTINLTIGSEVKEGAIILVQSKSDASANDMIFGTGITGPTVTGVNTKTHNFLFMYNGTAFVQQGLSVQID